MTAAGDLLLGASFLAVLSGLAGVAFQMARTEILERPTLGIRGMKRARALERSAVFAISEPAIRFVGAWFRQMPLKYARAEIRRALTRSGEHLGLSDDELFGTSILSSLIGGMIAAIGWGLFDWSPLLIFGAVSTGAAAPWLRLRAIAHARVHRVNRSLPSDLELAAMCMSAGLDFPGSLRRIVSSAPDPAEPIIEELSRVLQELDLGHTRRSAMESFAVRVPTDQVRELASAIVQAEQKGSPLGPVLAIQAQTQRLRRSAAAEQIASDAALMLMGPMTLIFLCVIVLLLGPVVVRFLSGGLGVS